MKRSNLLFVLSVCLFTLASGCAQTRQVDQESELKAKLYVEAMKDVLYKAGGPNEFIAIKMEVLEGLSDKQKQWVLQQMQAHTRNTYEYDEIEGDRSKFVFSANGDRIGTKNGVVLSVKLVRFNKGQAELEATAWHGNLGMDSITYMAKYENGSWTLKVKTITKA